MGTAAAFPTWTRATINNSTISGNSGEYGGGIYNPGWATLQNSLVADSPSGGNCYGAVTSKGYNLSSDNTCDFEKCSARPAGRTGNDATASATSDSAGESAGAGRRRSCAGKLVSVFEPSTEVIRKGKASQPTEFGKMIKIQEADALHVNGIRSSATAAPNPTGL